MNASRTYVCTVCGREGVWSDTWCWYGSYNQVDHDNSEPVVTMCSDACQAKWHNRNKWRFKERP